MDPRGHYKCVYAWCLAIDKNLVCAYCTCLYVSPPAASMALPMCLGSQCQHWIWGLLNCLFPGWQLVLPPPALDTWICPEPLQQLGVVAPQCSGETWGYKSDISSSLPLWPSEKPLPSAFLLLSHCLFEGSAFIIKEHQRGSKWSSRSVLAQQMDPMQSVSLAPFSLLMIPL